MFDRVPEGVGQGPGDPVGVTHGQLDRDLAAEGVPDDHAEGIPAAASQAARCSGVVRDVQHRAGVVAVRH